MSNSISEAERRYVEDVIAKRNTYFDEALLDFEKNAERVLDFLWFGNITGHAAYRFLMVAFQTYEEDMQYYQDLFELEVRI